jgi:hypothetical protein
MKSRRFKDQGLSQQELEEAVQEFLKGVREALWGQFYLQGERNAGGGNRVWAGRASGGARSSGPRLRSDHMGTARQVTAAWTAPASAAHTRDHN